MTKEQWIRHIEAVTGLVRPSAENGCMHSEWKEAVNKHIEDTKNNAGYHPMARRGCPQCNDRAKTKKRAASAKLTRSIYADMGLTRVIGSVSGSVYYE